MALRRLSRREHSSQEMTTFLQSKGVEPTEASAVVRSLIDQKLIDDDRFARIFARSYVQRGKGPYYILNRLKQKGIQMNVQELRALVDQLEESFVPVASDAADEIEGGDAIHRSGSGSGSGSAWELESAMRLLERRYAEAHADRATAVRAYQALLRRGFSPDTARAALQATKRKR